LAPINVEVVDTAGVIALSAVVEWFIGQDRENADQSDPAVRSRE
jgi:hypothetical protein